MGLHHPAGSSRNSSRGRGKDTSNTGSGSKATSQSCSNRPHIRAVNTSISSSSSGCCYLHCCQTCSA
jgi:hypothetical protein